MIGITTLGTQKLDKANGTSGKASLGDSILAYVSSKGQVDRESIQGTFDLFPGVSENLEKLLTSRLLTGE